MSFLVKQDDDKLIEILQNELNAHYNLMNCWGTSLTPSIGIYTNGVIPNSVDDWVKNSPWGPSLTSFDSCYDAFFHIVERDAHLSSEIEAAKQMFLSLDWHIEDATNEMVDRDIGDKVRKLFDLMDDGYGNGFEGIMALAWRGVETGMQPLALHWKSWEGWRVPLVISPRPPEMFHYVLHPNSEVKLHVKDAYGFAEVGEQVDPRLITVVHSNAVPPLKPYGTGMLAPIYMVSNFKSLAVYQEITYMESFGKPMLIIQYAPGMEAVVENIIRGVGGSIRGQVAYPVDSEGKPVLGTNAIDIQFHDVNRTAVDAYGPFIDQCNKEISKVCIGAPLTTGEARYGTYSLGTVHQFTTDIITAGRGKNIEKTINRIIKLIRYFNFRKRPAPRFVVDTRVDDRRGPDYIAMLQQVQALGVDLPVKLVRDAANIPAPQPGDKMLSALTKGTGVSSYGFPGEFGTPGVGATPTEPASSESEMGGQTGTELGALPETNTPVNETPPAVSGTAGMGGTSPISTPAPAAAAKKHTSFKDLSKVVKTFLTRDGKEVINKISSAVQTQLDSQKTLSGALHNFLMDGAKPNNINIGPVQDMVESAYYYGWMKALNDYNSLLSGQLQSDKKYILPATIGNKYEIIDALKNSTRTWIQRDDWNNISELVSERSKGLTNNILIGVLDDIKDVIEQAEAEKWDLKKYRNETKSAMKSIQPNKVIPEYLEAVFENAICEGYNNGLWIMANTPGAYSRIFGFRWAYNGDMHYGHRECDGYVGSSKVIRTNDIVPNSIVGCTCMWEPVAMSEAQQNKWVEYIGEYPNGKWSVLNSEPIQEFPNYFKKMYAAINLPNGLDVLNVEDSRDYSSYHVTAFLNNVFTDDPIRWLNEKGCNKFEEKLREKFSAKFEGIDVNVSWNIQAASDIFSDIIIIDGDSRNKRKEIDDNAYSIIKETYAEFEPTGNQLISLNTNTLNYYGKSRKKMVL